MKCVITPILHHWILVYLNLEWLSSGWFPVPKPFLFHLFRPAPILLCLFLCLCQSHPALTLLHCRWFRPATRPWSHQTPSLLRCPAQSPSSPVLSLICCWWSRPASRSLLLQVSHSSLSAPLVPSRSLAPPLFTPPTLFSIGNISANYFNKSAMTWIDLHLNLKNRLQHTNISILN